MKRVLLLMPLLATFAFAGTAEAQKSKEEQKADRKAKQELRVRCNQGWEAYKTKNDVKGNKRTVRKARQDYQRDCEAGKITPPLPPAPGPVTEPVQPTPTPTPAPTPTPPAPVQQRR